MNCLGFFPVDGVGDKMEEESKEQSGAYIEYFSDYEDDKLHLSYEFAS